MEPQDLIYPFSLLFGANLIVLLVWTITDPVQWVRRPIDDRNAELGLVETSTFGVCDSEHYRLYLGIILGINMVVSAIMLIQCYECRKISTDYSESLWISGAMILVVQVWVIGLPVLRLWSSYPSIVFAVEVAIVVISCMGTLLLIFIPKMGYLRHSRQDEAEKLKAGVPTGPPVRRESVTSHDHSHGSGSEDTYGRISGVNQSNIATVRMGNTKVTGLERPSTAQPADAKPHISTGLEGIRIMISSSRHSEELERLQHSLESAESRHKVLQDRLERLQEKMEQYIVAHHPHRASAGSFIIQARVSGTDGSR